MNTTHNKNRNNNLLKGTTRTTQISFQKIDVTVWGSNKIMNIFVLLIFVGSCQHHVVVAPLHIFDTFRQEQKNASVIQ